MDVVESLDVVSDGLSDAGRQSETSSTQAGIAMFFFKDFCLAKIASS